MASLLKRFFTKETRIYKEKVYNAADYDESFVVPKKLLRVTGIQMVDNFSEFVSSCLDLFYWFEFLNLLWAVPSELLAIVLTASSAGSFNDAIGVFQMIPCLGSSVLALFKSFKMVYNRDVYENLVKELRSMWPRGSVTESEHQVIQEALRQLNIIVKGYFWCNNVLLISYLVPPFFITMGRYLGYDGPMNLHFLYWLPFDPIQPVYYEIMLVMQTWHALIVIYWNVSWDMLFCTFICHITIQLDLLALRIQRLFHVEVDAQLPEYYPLASISKELIRNNENILEVNSKGDWEIRNEKELADIILRHRALMRLSADVEAMFSLALLINFMNGSVIICFCGFCSVLVEKWNDVAYKSFLLTTLSQTWLLCSHGQKLIDSSLGVSEALYNCGWYNASIRMRKSVLIMLHRAQKSVRVTTYGFSAISLASFSTIVKTSWSYFTLILNAYEK